MPQRNPFAVLGLPVDATAEAIKTAWRRLARQHHPDVASGEKAVQQGATRTMAEINAAYQELRDPEKRRLHREAGARDPRNGRDSEGPVGGYTRPDPDPTGPGWGARPRPSRPVTARIDTIALLRPRNSTLRPHDRSPLPGLPPRPRSLEWREPPRASRPPGPCLSARRADVSAPQAFAERRSAVRCRCVGDAPELRQVRRRDPGRGGGHGTQLPRLDRADDRSRPGNQSRGSRGSALHWVRAHSPPAPAPIGR